MANYYRAKPATIRFSVVGESSKSSVVRSNESYIDFDDVDDMSNFDAYATQNCQPISLKSDFGRYLEDPLVQRTLDFDVLQWWKMKKRQISYWEIITYISLIYSVIKYTITLLGCFNRSR